MQKSNQGEFPRVRMRRLRSTSWIRDMVAEYDVTPNDLVWPVFVCKGKGVEEPVATLPNVCRMSIDVLLLRVKEAYASGIPAIALFPVVPLECKDEKGQEAINPNNLICRTLKSLKDTIPEMGVICDVALDPYMVHGQDGIVIDGYVNNDVSLDVLKGQALLLAQAGADVVAPSDMMDGRIGAIRDVLEKEGQVNTLILSYAVKYASYFYGPFRDAVGSSKSLGKGDKKTYQMDFRSKREVLEEVRLDLSEGADMVMVKPGMPYLDVLKSVHENFNCPVFAYQVSGEYAMIMQAIQQGMVESEVMMESLFSFKRAGASSVFTYGAVDIAKRIC